MIQEILYSSLLPTILGPFSKGFLLVIIRYMEDGKTIQNGEIN